MLVHKKRTKSATGPSTSEQTLLAPLTITLWLTLDAEAGLPLLHRHESILDLQKLARPAEGCQRKAVRRVPHGAASGLRSGSPKKWSWARCNGNDSYLPSLLKSIACVERNARWFRSARSNSRDEGASWRDMGTHSSFHRRRK